MFKEMWERLNKGERFEILANIPLQEQQEQKNEDTFNIRLRQEKNVVYIKSGGYTIEIEKNGSKVVVYGKDGKELHEYHSACLVQNIIGLLFKIVGQIPKDWRKYYLERTRPGVRRLQSWVLAVITGFSMSMRHNPLICHPELIHELDNTPA